MSDVDLVVNCFERTYRKVTSEGFVQSIIEQNRFAFRNVVLLINNTASPADAAERATRLVDSGEITHFYCVTDHLDEALQKTGLTRQKLGKLPFYSDWALVALIVPGSDLVVHWDADVRLEEPMDWVSPSLELMERNSSIAIASPRWIKTVLRREERAREGDFALSYGFTDQVFLLRRSEFAQPIYKYWLPISTRFPVSHVGPYFEQWVDAYLRVKRRYRAIYLPAMFLHTTAEGDAYPGTLSMRSKNILRRIFLGIIRRLPFHHRFLAD